MTRVLLVRMSSLGDIIHTFPAVTDLARHVPGVAIHWVVEEQYLALAGMHPAVSRLIPVALRRWRRALLSSATWREIGAARRALGETHYDVVVETQGLLKSVLVAKQAHRPIYGFGRHTARDPLASFFYDRTVELPLETHKIQRYRTVAASALGYTFDPAIDYGLAAPPAPAFAPAAPYCVLLHGTARAAKLWAEPAWIEIARALEGRGLVVVLPWGDDREHARAARIGAALQRAVVAPRMTVTEAAGLLARARAVIGLDTGLTHLAAALAVPVVGIFCDSEPVDAQPAGAGPTAYRGGIGAPPSVAEVLLALAEVAPVLA